MVSPPLPALICVLTFIALLLGSGPWPMKSVCGRALLVAPDDQSSHLRHNPPCSSSLLASLGRSLGLVPVARQRIDQHPLRTANSAHGLQAVVANPVVDGSPRHAEQLGRVVKRNAAADMWFELALRVGGHPDSCDAFYKRTVGAGPCQVRRADTSVADFVKVMSLEKRHRSERNRRWSEAGT